MSMPIRSSHPETLHLYNLTPIASRLYSLFDISRPECDLAVQCLQLFFITRAHSNEPIVLPKIVDWAWHEFIVDTRSYHDFCKATFGQYLHHRLLSTDSYSDFDLNEALLSTANFYAKQYDIDFWKLGWLDPGRYSHILLRHPDKWKPHIVRDAPQLRTEMDLDISWLCERLSDRWDMSESEALTAVNDYITFLLERKAGAITPPHNHVDSAWREHILFTEKYTHNTSLIFGEYLHRPL